MTFNALIEGLQIFAKYEERGLDTHINGADHDVIWAISGEPKEGSDEDDPDDARFSKEDNARLKELGWSISEEYGDAWSHYC